jgi:DNA polymerase-3 subunit epsilon
MTASPQPCRDEIIQDAADLAAMAETLGRSADYRVLRRLAPRTEFAVTNGQTNQDRDPA